MEQAELERVDDMKDFLAETVDGFLKERLLNLQNVFRVKLKEAISELAKGKQNGIISICYLRSSIITGSHEFYIAYYEDEPFVEEEPEAIYLKMQSFLEEAEEDCVKINRILGNKYIHFFSSEKEEIHRWYLHLLYQKFGILMENLFEKVTMTGDIPVYYGGYMEEQRQIGIVKNENEVFLGNG